MSLEGKTYRLGDVADVSWGDTNTTKSAYVSDGYPAYSASGHDGFLPYADFEKTGVVVSAIGANCGKTWLAKGQWSCIKNTIRMWSKSPLLDTEYLYWLSRRNNFFPIRGSAQPFISQGDARAVSINLPAISDQKAIAHILGTLDDKIELNQKMNQTLEDIAKAIFKSWFVDFDPVRVKAEGRPTGLPDEISDLFPDAFEDSEIGEIPAGWRLQRLDNLLELAYGKSLPATVRKDGNVPVYGSGGIAGFHNEAHSEGPSIIVGRKGTVGSLYWSSGPFFPIDTVYFVKTQSSLHYCFYLLKTLRLETMNTDAAVPGLNRSNAYRLEFASAPDLLISAFDTIAHSLRHRMDLSEKENEILSELRDTLLPKLISGELRIPDAERFLEEAGI